ncbi:MAG: hypothetical protein A3F13_08920 [Gammaproteobacteria bacterium RIFCSPHIGHO2_12_FULL_40_19]|nr:MAG: hypothetical protein A3F13_08920 [Gammaproteobacteria bacterium RIFCSPHIGHO2_12_FULL_40_19]
MLFLQAGFSLIELMLALAISALLVTMSYPSYIDYQTHAQRNRAVVALFQLSGRLERYFGENDSYQNATIAVLHAADLLEDLPYQLQIASVSESHYEIQAVPQGVQAERDSHCGTLSLTDTNVRGISGDGDVKQCWR